MSIVDENPRCKFWNFVIFEDLKSEYMQVINLKKKKQNSRHEIAKILLRLALNTNKSINHEKKNHCLS